MLLPPQRTCNTRRKCMPRTSPNGIPMTSWTKWRIQSLRNHRVTSLGKEGAAHSCLTQFPHNGGTQGLAAFLGRAPCWLPGVHCSSSYNVVCVADGLYHQSDSEFRVASSVEQLNMEVGIYLNTKAKTVGRGWVQATDAEFSRALYPHLAKQSPERPGVPFPATFLWGHQTALSL